MSVITARIPDTLNKALTEVERSKNFIILKAIQNYVLELQEDIEDYNDAIEVLARNEPTVSFEEIERKYDLED